MNPKIRVFTPFLLAFFFVWIFVGVVSPSAQAEKSALASPTAQIHPALAKALVMASPDEYLPIIVTWSRDPAMLDRVVASPDRLTQRIQVIAALQEDALVKTQAILPILQAAETTGQAQSVRMYWISPVIALKAKPELIEALSLRSDLVQIRLDEPFHLPSFAPRDLNEELRSVNELPWGLSAINVELAEQTLGLDGTGVVVANVDSGVDWMHPALMTQYRGYRPDGLSLHFGNWHVSTNEIYTYPGDGNGHGTHTMGTIVGDDGQGMRIGVAPGAKWIAVKLFTNSGVTFESWVHDAFEWLLAPEGDPALAPDVVNNSWGSNLTTDERYRPDLQALQAAGILPVFSAGNLGPGAETAGIPGAYPEAFTVGAVDQLLSPTIFSSRGPSEWGEIKPEVAAPGVDILSAFPGGGYAYSDGTSMAAPHVTGMAALLLQADPTISPLNLDAALKYTATPIGAPVPNNESGWGLVNAYLAGLQVSDHGELLGTVHRSGGGIIMNPTVTANPIEGGPPAVITGDAMGDFSIHLAPGIYHVTASAFGFLPETLVAVQILTDTETEVSFTLTALPQGAIFGQVTDASLSVPLSATLFVEDTPVTTQTDPNTGMYSLSLPEGIWQVRVEADAHRVAHTSISVTAGQGTQVNFALEPSPRILLVDSGRWYYNSKVHYYKDALDSLDYFYHLRDIRDPFGQLGPADPPTLDELSAYDLVIWSSPLDSPGYIQIGDVITQYLEIGGSMLLSGQDIAFWDGGGNLLVPPVYFLPYLGAKFSEEGLLDALTGTPGFPLEGITVTLNTSDSDNQQYHPDAIEILDPLITESVLRWPDEEIGGFVSGGCHPYRVAWLGFGLEGAGPREVRIETLERLMSWFIQPPPAFGIQAMGPDNILIGAPGEVISDVIQLANTGIHTDTYDLSLNGSSWPLTLQAPDGSFLADGDMLTIPGCTNLTLTSTLTIPSGLPRDTYATYTLGLASEADPSLTTSILLNAKTPAPILLLDDGRWQNFGDDYAVSLDSLSLSYDLVTMGGQNLKSPRILDRYPLILWTTGLDWFSPLTDAEKNMLTDYLHQGGRLLFTSQDLLEHQGDSKFVSEELGVLRYTYHTTPTQVLAAPGNPLGNMGLWSLDYPYQNWSDQVIPQKTAHPFLFDQNLGIVGVGHAKSDQRTAFFSFPLETLDDYARQTLIGRTLLWISPVGESQLHAPTMAAESTSIPITMTVGSATTQTLSGVQMNLPLPQNLELVEGSLQGGWTYNVDTRTLKWIGDLAPAAKVVLNAELNVAPDIPDGTVLLLRAAIDAGDQLILTSDAEIYVDVPWLTARMLVAPQAVWPGQEAGFQLTLHNAGVLTASVRLTDSLPAELTLITHTMQASSGEIIARWGRIEWNGLLPPGGIVTITYSQEAGFWDPFDLISNWVEIVAPYQRLGTWAALRVAGQAYFPGIWKP